MRRRTDMADLNAEGRLEARPRDRFDPRFEGRFDGRVDDRPEESRKGRVDGHPEERVEGRARFRSGRAVFPTRRDRRRTDDAPARRPDFDLLGMMA